MDPSTASLARRLTFAGGVCWLFDRCFSRRPLRWIAVRGEWAVMRFPTFLAKVAFDLLECVRTASRVPAIGNVELALDEARQPLPQPPRFLGYWHDPDRRSLVGVHLGVDLIRHRGRYYLIENNGGPTIYRRRRDLYESPYDPLVTSVVETAAALGFRRAVPIAFRWESFHREEFARAGRAHGVAVEPADCPLAHGPAPAIVALPRPLAQGTLYVVQGGLTPPVLDLLGNKWATARWLGRALAEELPAETRLARPATDDRISFPLVDHGPRWPNLVVKLSAGSRSRQVAVGRFESAEHARTVLGGNGARGHQGALGALFRKGLLHGRDRLIFQEFIPPEIDSAGRARLLRLHLLLTPLGSAFVSAHRRVARRPVPERFPSGLVGDDGAVVFNDATFERLPPEREEELREVAADLGRAMQSAVGRVFQTGPPGGSAAPAC